MCHCKNCGDDGENGHAECHGCQKPDTPALAPFPFDLRPRRLAFGQELTFVRLQPFRPHVGPAFRLDQRLTAQQQSVGPALAPPKVSLALQGAQVCGKPGGVVCPNRLYEAVMHQLHPGAAAAQLGTQQEALHKRIHSGVGHGTGAAAAFIAEDGVADAGLGEQFLVEPGAQRSLAHARNHHLLIRQHCSQRVDVELLQRLVDIPRLSQIRLRDEPALCILTAVCRLPSAVPCAAQPFPQLKTHHLQLHRLDIRPGNRRFLAGQTNLTQVVNQLFGHAGGEGAAP